MTEIKLLELFGGIGACTKALERLGIPHTVVDYVEIDKYAVKSYNAIHGTNFEPQDIREWNKDIQVDLIMHGSPCQDFSLAGLQKGGDEGSGTRSSLMYETIRIVSKLKPKYVIWENVKNLVSEKHIHNFYNYIQRMRELGYKSYYKVLNAKDYGIPQNRERVFTISIRSDLHQVFEFPEPVELKLRLKDLLEDEVDEKYYLSEKMLNYCLAASQEQQDAGNGYEFAPVDTEQNGGGIAKTIVTKEGSRLDNNFIKQDFKLTTKNKRLKETLEQRQVEDGAWIDDYNQLVNNDGIAGTIQNGIDFRNHQFIAQADNEEHLKKIANWKSTFNPLTRVMGDESVTPTLTSNEWRGDHAGMLLIGEGLKHEANLRGMFRDTIPIKNATRQGYLLAKEGDGIDISGRMESHRGTVQDGLAQTINTNCDGGW